MTPIDGELQQRVAALRADFAALGARAAGAARSLGATIPPASELLDQLDAARSAFSALRTEVLERAGALSVILDGESLGSLRDLGPALAAIAAEEVQRARLAAWDAARREALGVLDGVLALIHREDRRLPALEEVQHRAGELHATLSGPPPAELEDETSLIPTRTRPYVELLALVEGWNVLDDDRCAALQDAITESFSRPLSLAALRGKLGRAGEVPPAVPRPRVRAPAPPSPVEVQTVAPERPVEASAAVAPVTASPAAPAPPTASEVAPPPADFVAPVVPPGLETVAVDVELDSTPALDAAPAAPAHDAELEALARQMAPWWVAACTGFQQLTESGRAFGDAARDYLGRFPHLLSVPLQTSAEFEGGELAEGYSLLLAHIEKQEPGFVEGALGRLSPQFAAHDPSAAYPLAQELYLHMVAEGRLYKTYPDFVREVMRHTVPRLGVWVQGGIVESDEETRLFMRGEGVGSTQEQARTVTEPKERLGPHVFRITLRPLTTRFFTLRLAGDTLADPPNVEMKLTENDAPTDHAWMVTLPALGQGQPAAPRKHRPGGTTLEELGPQFGGFWLAVFNADPRSDRVYELSIILRRKPPPLTDAQPVPEKHFFGKRK